MYRLSKLQFIKEFAAFEPTARRALADLWDLQQSRIERIYGVVAIPPKFAQPRSSFSGLPLIGDEGRNHDQINVNVKSLHQR